MALDTFPIKFPVALIQRVFGGKIFEGRNEKIVYIGTRDSEDRLKEVLLLFLRFAEEAHLTPPQITHHSIHILETLIVFPIDDQFSRIRRSINPLVNYREERTVILKLQANQGENLTIYQSACKAIEWRKQGEPLSPSIQTRLEEILQKRKQSQLRHEKEILGRKIKSIERRMEAYKPKIVFWLDIIQYSANERNNANTRQQWMVAQLVICRAQRELASLYTAQQPTFLALNRRMKEHSAVCSQISQVS